MEEIAAECLGQTHMILASAGGQNAISSPGRAGIVALGGAEKV